MLALHAARTALGSLSARTTAVHLVSAAFVIVALLAGAALGLMVNRDPAKAQTPAPVPCVGLCVGVEDTTSGNGGFGQMGGSSPLDGSGGAVGNGAIGTTP